MLCSAGWGCRPKKEAKFIEDMQPGSTRALGEVASAKLIGYLNPREITVCTDQENLADVLVRDKLKREPEGEAVELHLFWRSNSNRPTRDMVQSAPDIS